MSEPDAPPLAIPFAESPLVERATDGLSPEQRQLVREFAERGYLVIDLELPDFDELAERVIATLARHYPANDRRIDEAWYFCPGVRAIACAQPVLELLRLLYGRAPIPFQTLNFDAGTQQAAHSDTIHFHCSPPHYMAGVWVALEDVDERNGALFVYPGSHRLPSYDMTQLGLDAANREYGRYEQRVAEILAASRLEREVLSMRKGQAVIWAANLYHGGAAVLETGRTRHSQVTHYYFEDCLYYFPMGSEPYAGKVTAREVIDLTTGRFVTPRQHGRDVSLHDYPHLWAYERPLPEWVEEAPARSEAPDSELDPELMQRRIRALEQTVEYLREDGRAIREDYLKVLAEDEEVRADNRSKEAFIQKRDSELAYKVARRITKTWRALTGRSAEDR